MTKYMLSAACLLMLLASGCKGRHADGTPAGETVEVEFTQLTEVADEPGVAPDTIAQVTQPLPVTADTIDTAGEPQVQAAALTGRPQ